MIFELSLAVAMQLLCLFMHLLCFMSMSISESVTAIEAFKYNNLILETEAVEVKQSVSFLEDTWLRDMAVNT